MLFQIMRRLLEGVAKWVWEKRGGTKSIGDNGPLRGSPRLAQWADMRGKRSTFAFGQKNHTVDARVYTRNLLYMHTVTVL